MSADIIDLIYEDHDWFRRRFFLLDAAETVAELTAVWEPLASRLDTHAQAEETVFYPALLKKGEAGDPEDETEDAIDDHNAIRDAVRAARGQEIGSKSWYDAVGKARVENGEHLDEEERDAIPDFIKSTTPQQRRDLAMQWLAFYHRHPDGRDVDDSDRDAATFIEQNS